MTQAQQLSRQKTARALRYFTITGCLWAVYGPNATVTGSVFTGLALRAGVAEANIAFLAGLTGLVGLWQLVSSQLTQRVEDKRRLCLLLGFPEIILASLTVVAGLLLPQALRLPMMIALLFGAFIMGHSVSPMFNSWLSNVIPAEVRATYLGRRMFFITVTSAVYLFVASRWLDLAPGNVGFYTVFAVGGIAGLLGYALLGLTAFPPVQAERTESFLRRLADPLRDRGFAVLLFFVLVWTIAMRVSGPFVSVYMLRYLRMSFTHVAILTNITLAMMLVGYLLWGTLAQRFGSRPVIQVVLVPALCSRAVWALTTPANCSYLAPLACFFTGLGYSGATIAASNLLYKTVPAGRENSTYFALWTACSAVGMAVGPFVGGSLRKALPEVHVPALGLDLTAIQLIFVISSALYLIPLLLSIFLVEEQAASPRHLLGQFRGNFLSFAYNFALFEVARKEETRADAIRGLARSHVPLVTPLLRHALEDPSQAVRHEAALGLGEARAEEHVPALVDALHDGESDIRPEAAAALGRIGSPAGLQALLDALEDSDPRVRCSAALALGEMGGDVAQQRLRAALAGDFDRQAFPTLVEAASKLNDLEVIPLALAHLDEFRNPVVRTQILNGVCRVVGEPSHFYRLFTGDELSRAAMTESLLLRIGRLLSRAAGIPPERRRELRDLACDMRHAIGSEDIATALRNGEALCRCILELPDLPPVSAAAAEAVRTYLSRVDLREHAGEALLFTVLCLTSAARHLPKRSTRNANSRPRD